MARYNYKADYKDFKNAQKLYWRSNNSRRFRFHFYLWGLLVTGLILGALAYPMRADSPVRLALMPIAVGCMAGGSVTALLRPFQMERCYKALGGDPQNPQNIYLEMSDGLLVSGIEGKSEGRFMRGAVCDFVEDKDFILLFLSPKRFLYVPKEQLPLEAIDELNTWLCLPTKEMSC